MAATRTIKARVEIDGNQKYKQALNDLNNGNKSLAASMKSLQSEFKGNADSADFLASKLGVNIPKGAKDALNWMSKLSSGTASAMGGAVIAVTALIKAVKELHDTTVEAAKSADEILTQSMVTGLSTQTTQQLKYAEELIDVSASTITGSLTKLTNNMQSARDGNKALAESFQNLGVSIVNEADGSLRSAEDVFYDIIDALGEVGNATERDAIAMDLFGKSAQELNPLIIQGTEVLRGYMEAANENYVLTDDELKQLAEVDDAIQQQTLTWDGLKNQIAVQFAPASKETIETFTKLVETAGRTLIDSGIVEALAAIIKSLMSILQTVGDLMGDIPGLGQGLEQVKNAFYGVAVVVATLADALRVVVGLLEMTNPFTFKSGWGNVKQGLGWDDDNWSNLQELKYSDTSGNYYDPTTGLYTGNYGYNAGGNDNWRGGLTWVGETGPELLALPGGSQILNAQDSAGFGGDVYNFTVDVRQLEDLEGLIRWAKGQRVRERMR